MNYSAWFKPIPPRSGWPKGVVMPESIRRGVPQSFAVRCGRRPGHGLAGCPGQLGRAHRATDGAWTMNPPRGMFYDVAADGRYRLRRKNDINRHAPEEEQRGKPRGSLPHGARGVIGKIPSLPTVIICPAHGCSNEVAPPGDNLLALL